MRISDWSSDVCSSDLFGVILQPRFIPGLSITADYYDIKISKVISPVDAQTILNGCYDGPDLNNAFCQLIFPRNPDGTFQLPALLQSSLNFAAQRAKGLDVDVAYNHRFDADNRLVLRFVDRKSTRLNPVTNTPLVFRLLLEKKNN